MLSDWEKMVLTAARGARRAYMEKERLAQERESFPGEFDPHTLYVATNSYARECTALEILITEE